MKTTTILTGLLLAMTLISCKKNSIEPETKSEIKTHQAEIYLTSSGYSRFYLNGNEMVAYVRPTTYSVKTGDILRGMCDAYPGPVYSIDNVSIIIYIDGKEELNICQPSNADVSYTVK